MVPFVKIYTRRFHITPKIFLRKIAPKISSNEQKNTQEDNFNSSSSCQNTCPDYLGVESDENVITVKPQKHRHHEPERDDNREKFYRASFGVIRFDADNKLKYHGQYNRRVDFIFPHVSSETVKVRNISENSSYKNQIDEDLSLGDFQKTSGADTLNIKTDELTSSKKNSIDMNYIDNHYFGDFETENDTQQPASEKLNYLEKDYFETLVSSKKHSLEQNTFKHSEETVDSPINNENQINELNYLEKDYFDSIISSENRHVEQDSADFTNSKQDFANVESKDQSEEFKYSNKSNFETLSNSETHLNQNISTCKDNEKNINVTFDIKSQNTFSKNNLSCSVNELSFIDKSFYENCSSLYSVKNNNIVNENLYKYDDENLNDKTKNQDTISNLAFSNDISESTKKQDFEVDIKQQPFSKTQKNNIMSLKNIESSAKHSNISKELCNDPIKSFSMENNFKFSKLISEKPNQNDEIPTAHDFVQNLREQEKIPSRIQISKGKSTTEEKLDSKGFRILKNQVPNLAYFTRDEILNILKQNVVYSDDDLLILNKPYSLVMHESKTTKEPCLSTFLDDLAKEMDKKSKNPKLFTVHRLDKETTGCLLLARNETMAMHLKALFAQRKIVKKYWIITSGVPNPSEGVIDMPISEGSIDNKKRMVLHPKLPADVLYKSHAKKGKPAVTTYKVISESGNAALVEVFPKTGVKHQIRVHFGFGLGCPVLGDHKYSHLDKLAPQKLPSDMLQRLHVRQSKVRHIPMHIHAKSVGIPHYFDQRDLFVNIPIPDYFKINLKRLKFRKKDMVH